MGNKRGELCGQIIKNAKPLSTKYRHFLFKMKFFARKSPTLVGEPSIKDVRKMLGFLGVSSFSFSPYATVKCNHPPTSLRTSFMEGRDCNIFPSPLPSLSHSRLDLTSLSGAKTAPGADTNRPPKRSVHKIRQKMSDRVEPGLKFA